MASEVFYERGDNRLFSTIAVITACVVTVKSTLFAHTQDDTFKLRGHKTKDTRKSTRLAGFSTNAVITAYFLRSW